MKKIFFYLQPILRKKSTILTFILIGISMSLILILSSYYATSYNGYYGEIRENIYYNTYWVTTDNEKNNISDIKRTLENVEHIVGIFSEQLWINGGIIEEFKKNDKVDGRINLQVANNQTLPEIVEGSDFPIKEGNYIICPQNFIPTGGTLEKYSRFDMLNLKEYLGKKINLNYMNFLTDREDLEIDLELVGIYKNSNSLTDENICYVQEETLHNMYLKQNNISVENKNNEMTTSSFYVQIDKYENKEQVKKMLENYGYKVESITEVAYEDFDKISSNIATINIVLNFLIFGLLFLSLLKLLHDNLRYYNLLYYLGYSKINICIINTTSNFILIFISSIITLFISTFLSKAFNIILYFRPLIFSKFEVIIDYSPLLSIIPSILLITLIVSLIGYVKLNMDEVKLK